jgi:hypothetical protein
MVTFRTFRRPLKETVMNKDDLKRKTENLKEHVKEAAESIGKQRSTEAPGRSASGSERAPAGPGGKSAAAESVGASRSQRASEAIEPEDIEGAAGDDHSGIEESEDD